MKTIAGQTALQTPLRNCSWVIVFQFSSVQSLSRVRLFATPWIAAGQASLSITISWSSLRPTSIESVMSSSHLILCRPLFFLPPIPPSIRVFSNESTLIVFILLQIKLGLQVSHCALKKKSQQFYSDHEEGTQSGLLAFALPLLRTGALVPAEASCTHPPPQRVQTNLGESPLALGSLMLVDDPGFYLAVNK